MSTSSRIPGSSTAIGTTSAAASTRRALEGVQQGAARGRAHARHVAEQHEDAVEGVGQRGNAAGKRGAESRRRLGIHRDHRTGRAHAGRGRRVLRREHHDTGCERQRTDEFECPVEQGAAVEQGL